MIPLKSATFRAAPPIRPPSTSGFANNSFALEGLVYHNSNTKLPIKNEELKKNSSSLKGCLKLALYCPEGKPRQECLFNLFPDFRQVFLHPFGILIGDNLQQPFQFQADILHLSGSAGIEQDFLK